MKKYLLILGLFLGASCFAHAQNYSLPNNDTGCPDQCRVIPWSTGSDIWNGGTLPVYGQVTCTPLHEDGATDDTADINACISAAAAGTGAYATCHAAGGCAVFIPAGTVVISGIVRVQSNTVLRGAGPSTLIKIGAAGYLGTTSFSHSGNIDPTNSYATKPSMYLLSGTPQKGDTTVTCGDTNTNCAKVSVGTWIKIAGNDDPSIITDNMNGSPGNFKCDMCGDNTGYYLMAQYVQVTACSPGCPSGSANGTVWTISRELYYPPYTTSITVYDTANNPTTEPAGAKFNIITFTAQKAGYEYFNSTTTGDLGGQPNIDIMGCLYCWVKGVETSLTGNGDDSACVRLAWSYGGEVRDSYCHDQRDGSGGRGYGIYVEFTGADDKVENNIIRHQRHGLIFQGGGAGVAELYNYVDDLYTDDLTYMGSARTVHGAHPFMILWEGNIMSHIAADDTWGTSSHQVFYRNWVWGDETMNWTKPAGSAPTPTGVEPDNGFDAFSIAYGHGYYSWVGNVEGHTSLHTTWSGAGVLTGTATNTTCDDNYARATPYVFSLCGTAGPVDPAGYSLIHTTALGSSSTGLIHGDWNYKTVGVPYWNGGANHTLAPSLYYASKPSFLTAYAWPLEGPEGNPTINNNPAYNCWLAGPATGGAFDARACYAVTASTGSTASGAVFRGGTIR